MTQTQTSVSKEPGKFIVIEGVDGSGKTTQLKELVKWLKEEKKIDCLTLDFPQYNKFWGKVYGKFLAGEFGELFEVSPYLVAPLPMLDQASMAPKITAALAEGKWVLSNRYLTSSLVHQTSKFPKKKQKSQFRQWLVEAAYEHLNMVKEDLVIALYVDPLVTSQNSQKALARKTYTKKRDIAEENLKHQVDSATELKIDCKLFKHWKMIDCMKHYQSEANNGLASVTSIQLKVRQIVEELIRDKRQSAENNYRIVE